MANFLDAVGTGILWSKAKDMMDAKINAIPNASANSKGLMTPMQVSVLNGKLGSSDISTTMPATPTNSTVPSTKLLKDQIDALIGGAGVDMDTLKEIADVVSNNSTGLQSILTQLAGKANKTELVEMRSYSSNTVRNTMSINTPSGYNSSRNQLMFVRVSGGQPITNSHRVVLSEHDTGIISQYNMDVGNMAYTPANSGDTVIIYIPADSSTAHILAVIRETGAVTVDSALSASSTNPVQNKVINTALGDKVDKASIDTSIPYPQSDARVPSTKLMKTELDKYVMEGDQPTFSGVFLQDGDYDNAMFLYDSNGDFYIQRRMGGSGDVYMNNKKLAYDEDKVDKSDVPIPLTTAEINTICV